MKVLSEETDLCDISMLKKSDRTSLYLDERIHCYILRENNHSLCLERTAVLKHLLSYYSCDIIYEFFCVISEVNTET